MSNFWLLVAVFWLLHPAPSSAQEITFDYLIKHAVVFDGKSAKGVEADVGILGDRIEAIGDLSKREAREVIPGKGLVLAPGFIDAHTHSDFNPWVYSGLPNKITQGVTTEVIGNCGFSAAPVLGPHSEHFAGVWRREGVWVPERVPWKTFREYREAMEQEGLITNFVGLIGHGNLRSAVMGFSPQFASESDLEAMKSILTESMNEGAYGISFGLSYLPGRFADTAEVAALCQEAARRVGLCAFHMRSEGTHLIESIEETLQIAKQTKARIQISHLKASGRQNGKKISEAFQLIEQARFDGVEVVADAYPYTAGYAELGVTLPASLYQREDRIRLFKDLFKRQEILDILRHYDDQNKIRWDSIMIAAAHRKEYQQYEGKTLKEIARKTNKEPEKFLIEILADNDFEVSAFYFSQTEGVVDQVFAKHYVAVGSDNIADGTRKPHPRVYGTFPRALREYVRKKRAVGLGQMIRKMTSLPADHFGIEGRGTIREGAFADLVLFDAGDVTDKASYENPDRLSEGIKWVFLNGRPVVRKGKFTGEKFGRFLTLSH